ncbi:DUF6471 domain-containing protein [Spirosoma fluviale]|nr:DUF6471 domain-containing protein [Spirosoma fluviale]
MKEIDWNEKAKRLLKSELVRRGVTNESLTSLLEEIGVEETKAGIDSKISRGTFSAAFLLQCLNAIGCKSFVCEIESFEPAYLEEPQTFYKSQKSKPKKTRQ